MVWTQVGSSNELVYETVTIPDVTGIMATGLYMVPFMPLWIAMPAAWVAAALTFEVSHDDTTYVDLFIGGSETSYTVAVSQAIGIDADDALKMGPYLKLRSGTAATPVDQTAARVLTIYARRIQS